MHKPLRIGVIGAGSIATSAHLPAIARLPEHYRLVAVSDVRPEVARAVADRYAVDAHEEYHALLARNDIDVVDICTPEFLHAEQTLAAAAAGKHVFCEKPMASSVAEADAMLAACRSAGVHLMIGHSRRFTPRYRQIRAALDRGEIGEVRFVRENERRPAVFPATGHETTPMWTPPGAGGAAKPWTKLAAYTHGAAMTNAVHEMDLMRWFAGSEPVAVYAESRITDPEGEVADFLTCLVRFASGATGGSEIVNRLPTGHPLYHMAEVIGAHGSIRAFDSAMAPLAVGNGERLTFPGNPGGLLHVDSAYETELRGFAEAVLANEPPPMDPWEARQALAMSVAAVRASNEGRWVTLDEVAA
ncbi:MAG: Gfo/Idh/MocA family oxidoreductase [Thermomicrobiales bacterium]|nr:Gfo/Idh/MocA family oxidoreductase [Thermomicrobiales bacterium]